MNIYDLIIKRRTVRNFEDREIPDDIVDKLLDGLVQAPSGGNIQPVSVILVKDTQRRKELASIVGNQPWVAKAPLSMIFCIDFLRIKKWAALSQTEFKGERAFSPFLIAFADIICAAQNIVILAESFGLGSVYIGTILSSINRARDYFLIPQFVLPMMVLSLGYPKTIPTSVPKLKKDIVVHKEIYNEHSENEIRKAFEEKYGSLKEMLDRYFQRTCIDTVETDESDSQNTRKKMEEQLIKLEIKNNAQFLFNFKYPADFMIKLNETLVSAFKNAGFDFFDFLKGN